MAVAVLAIVWHQQRSIERLRAEMRTEINGLRAEMNQRLARIEGYLGIGLLPEAAAAAAGAGLVGAAAPPAAGTAS